MKLVDYMSLYPSIAAVISGVLAIVITFSPPVTMQGKNIWLSAFIFIALTAIIATFWQQAILNQKELLQSQRDTSRDNDFAFLKGQMTSLISLSSKSQPPKEIRDQLTAELALFSKKISPSIRQTGAPQAKKVETLKQKSLLTAYNIRKIFTERQKIELAMQDNPKSYSLLQDYKNETVSIYATTFSLQVKLIHDEFLAQGITDGLFEVVYKNPQWASSVLTVAFSLEKLAKRIE